MNKKIGIITHPLRTNYGGLLQAYALQSVLKKNNHSPITERISNNRTFCQTRFIAFIIGFISFLLRRRKFSQIFLVPTLKEERHISQYTHMFIEKYINTIDTFSDEDYDEFDVIIAGSDQVWRTSSCDSRIHIDRSFLNLPVNDKCLKISYAASFGHDKWNYTNKNTEHIKNIIKDFKAVSVREKGGVDVCEKHLNIKPTHVLDPTLLLDKNDYLSLLSNDIQCKFNGVFVYVLDKTDFIKDVIRLTSDSLNINSFEINPKQYNELTFWDKLLGKTSDLIFPPVENWIASFRDSDMVITDSFHGTVFSIIFKKQFISIINEDRGASRFISLLEMFGLEDRLVKNENLTSINFLLSEKIDYNHVDVILKEKQKESLYFLLEAINN